VNRSRKSANSNYSMFKSGDCRAKKSTFILVQEHLFIMIMLNHIQLDWLKNF